MAVSKGQTIIRAETIRAYLSKLLNLLIIIIIKLMYSITLLIIIRRILLQFINDKE